MELISNLVVQSRRTFKLFHLFGVNCIHLLQYKGVKGNWREPIGLYRGVKKGAGMARGALCWEWAMKRLHTGTSTATAMCWSTQDLCLLGC
jgi:hypothetical protein